MITEKSEVEAVPVAAPVAYRPIKEVMAGLSPVQGKFLYLRLMNMGVAESLRIISRSENSATVWRCGESLFKQAEEYLLANKEHYVAEAVQAFLYGLNAKGIYVLEKLVDMGLKWGSLDKEDKRYVFKAIEMVTSGFKPGGGGKNTESYEEIVHKIHRGLKSAG